MGTKPVDKLKMKKIRKIIIDHKEPAPFGKRVMFYLLEASNNLKVPVGLKIHKCFAQKGKEAAQLIEDIKMLNVQIPGTTFGYQSYYTDMRGGSWACYLIPHGARISNIPIVFLLLDWRAINQIDLSQ